ncbi:MAG: PAS domain-containing protein [Candidatus Eremiobacteraeota bacterium]|nr:PAS domain-containing protein [Candidatus Eremiobacteraeota bacterium]MCW5869504.1 PAS domain-containing protein [Candidatus Eremiobacteraeota bacterium]
MLRLLAQGRNWAQILELLPELAEPAEWSRLSADADRLEQHHLFSEILEQIPDMIFVKEARELRFVLLNRAGEELLGFPRSEMLGKTDFDFFPAHEAAYFQEKDRLVLNSGQLLDIPQEQVMTRSGTRSLYTQKIPLCDEDGTPRYLVGVSRDITEFVQAQAEVARSQQQLRRLSAQLQQAQEDERQRLARELHDELGQVLTGVRIELAWLEKRLPEDQVGLVAHLEQAQALVHSALATVRRVATALRPQILDDLGLQAAIDWLLQEICGRAGIAAHLEFRLNRRLAPELSTTIYRACQEALTNIVRHSQARRAAVRIHLDGDWVVTEVEDDGLGLQTPREGSLGLVGIRERVQLHGGALELSAPVDCPGTLLVFRLPLA